jgi:acyl-CoA reductase-like NAD-dependent aldehyde dehydrogenase
MRQETIDRATLAARRARLSQLGAAIAERRIELVAGLVRHAKRIRCLAAAEVDLALRRIAAFGELEPSLLGREPVGTVAIVLPGNVSISNPVATLGTAFLAGNRVIARFPSALRGWAGELEPLFTAHLPGVSFDHRGGPDFLRAALADPAIQALLVFGDDGWAAGCEPEVRASRRKLIFEGPGKDPFVVLPGADLEGAARDAVRGAYFNAGQACTSPERFYVHAALAEEFTARVVELTRREVVGEPERDEVTIGPIVSRRVVARIAAQLADALARGARLATGGGMAESVMADGTPATYVQPTVVTGAAAGMALMQDETFGPIIPIQEVASEEEAVGLAVASRFGLAASLYGGSEATAGALAAAHGQVFRDEIWLDHGGRHLHAPYGGRKRSGWVWAWEDGRFVHRDGARVNAVELSRAAL